MLPRSSALVLFAVVLACGAREASAGTPPPGPPLVPKPERTDAELFEKAARIQARMWKHISREGLLVFRHRQDATLEQLSHDALSLADAAIWTGCYAASQACRWHVTRDPEALAQVRVLAGGLALLTDATGVPGCLSRTVGHLIEGEPRPKRLAASPVVEGLYFRDDISRDQLAGWTLGWAAIAKYVEDADIQALARRQLDAVADRLKSDHMFMRDHSGHKTEHGDLDIEIGGMPFIKNGSNAAIGLSPFVVATAIGDNERVRHQLDRLEDKGYRQALGAQHAGIGVHLKASNVFMTDVALLSIRLWSSDGKTSRYAKDALRSLRARTRGWWNAGFCACQLLSGLSRDRKQITDELRVVLHVMSEDEIPSAKVREWRLRRAATVTERGNTTWSWKAGADLVRQPIPEAGFSKDRIHTRADWLFAYWLARAAGELAPESGPGAQPPPVMLGIKIPEWALEVPLSELDR